MPTSFLFREPADSMLAAGGILCLARAEDFFSNC